MNASRFACLALAVVLATTACGGDFGATTTATGGNTITTPPPLEKDATATLPIASAMSGAC